MYPPLATAASNRDSLQLLCGHQSAGLRAADAFEFTSCNTRGVQPECPAAPRDFVRKMVPPFASSNRPRRRCIAPVNAPFRAKEFGSNQRWGKRAQFTLTKARCERRIAVEWRGRPVPYSSSLSTNKNARIGGSNFRYPRKHSCNPGEVPTISSNINA